VSDERDAERYYEEQRERAAYEDMVAAKDADDWRAMETELTALRRVAEAAREIGPSSYAADYDALTEALAALTALHSKEGV
jgi:hypothetical protein